jgi:glycosidase
MIRWLALLLALGLALPALATPAPDYRARPPEAEVVYFVLPDRFANGDPANDRGGLAGGRLVTGFDPADKGFYHGGDIKGLIARLDYIQGLGASAIWLGPIFKNKPVQGEPGQESAGYHGYWITDFTRVDPHFGSNDEFAALVSAVHARGMKLYMDIVVNHTADVIQYREGRAEGYRYRAKADYPFTRKGGVAGAPINTAFAGDHDASPANWARLTDPAFAYTPYVPAGEEHVKQPDWLNDPHWYHNRGNTDWQGESAQYGDFSGLDDLATENPRVVQGFIDIYGQWIDRFGVDGFRIDTAKHVNPEFWRTFVPAMQARARARGIPHFHIFGEVANDGDSAELARWTRVAGLPSVLDFGFMGAVADALSGKHGTQRLARLFADDVLYAGGAEAARQLPTFLGNHDVGRLAMLLKRQNPALGDDELLARSQLAHAMLLTLRGVPVIYSGDEQGFVGAGGDQAARQDMWASQTPTYRAEAHLGGGTGAMNSYNSAHPLYAAIARLAALRHATPALREGTTLVRGQSEEPGLFAVSRFDPVTHREVLVAFNTASRPLAVRVEVEAASSRFTALAGVCPARSIAPGSLALALPPLTFAVCAADPESK